MTLKNIAGLVIKVGKYCILVLICIIPLWFAYKISPHSEIKTTLGCNIRSYWQWGKVYKQDVSYVTNPAKVCKVLIYSRKDVPFLFTPGFRGCLEPIIKEFYEDTNGDGKWDIVAIRDPQTGDFLINEDTDYDGKPDKTYTKQY